jgi:hypothetical protein
MSCLKKLACILGRATGREISIERSGRISRTALSGRGVSPSFAMTKMDLEQHPELDVYVEDEAAQVLLREIIVTHSTNIISRCLIVPSGAASVGQSLGQMAHQNRFPRPTCVFLDGDQPPAIGCVLLPGGDAPERVVFEQLAENGWKDLAMRVGRSHSALVDACNRAMTFDDHHEWVRLAADELVLGGQILWQALCAVWAKECLSTIQANAVIDPLRDALR